MNNTAIEDWGERDVCCMNKCRMFKRMAICVIAFACAFACGIGVVSLPSQAHAQQGLTMGTFKGSEYQNDSYRVVYKACNGTGDISAAVVQRNTKTRLATCGFERPGYVFVGWNTKKNGKGKSYKENAAVKNLAKAGEKIVLYAQWKSRGQVAAEAALTAKKKHWTNRSRYHGLLYGRNAGDPSICSEFSIWCLYQGGAQFGKNLMNKKYSKEVLHSSGTKWSYSWKHVAFYRDNPDKGTVHKVGDGYIPQPGDLIVYVNSKHSGVTNKLKDARVTGCNHMRICVKSNKSGKFWYVGGNGLSSNYIESGSSSVGATSASYFIHINWEKVTGKINKGI